MNTTASIDYCQHLIKLAQDLFVCDMDKVTQMVGTRCGQYLMALTGQKYNQVVFDAKGEMLCVDSATKENVAFSALPPAVQDLAFLSLKFSIIENFSRQRPVPVFLDDPFKTVPANLHELLGRMLAVLGKVTQVVLLTDQANVAQHAQAKLQL